MTKRAGDPNECFQYGKAVQLWKSAGKSCIAEGSGNCGHAIFVNLLMQDLLKSKRSTALSQREAKST
jgi:hypothetical protein